MADDTIKMQSGSNKTEAAKQESSESGGEVDNQAENQTDTNNEQNIDSFEESGGKTTNKQSENNTDQDSSNQSSDTFATSFDPNNLTDELKPVYKQMQGDYTRKTQELAEARKQTERVQQYIPLLNRVLSNPELMNMALGNTQPGQTPTQTATEAQEEQIPDDPKEYAEWVKGKTLEEVQRQFAEQEQARRLEQARQRDFEQAQNVDPRLSEDQEFSNIILGLVASNPQFNNQQISATEATKQAISFYDGYVNKLVKEKEQDRVRQAKNKQHVIKDTETGSSDTSPQDQIGVSMREIAKKEGFI